MLKYRVLTAFILLPLVIGGIWSLPSVAFVIMTGLILLAAAWEWARLCGFVTHQQRLVYVGLMSLVFLLAYWLPVIPLLAIVMLCWAWAFLIVWRYEKGFTLWGLEKPVVKASLGVMMLMGCWVGLNIIHNSLLGPLWLLFALVIVWDMDTGAYFAGRFWGKHLLMPRVSPKKTWEGLFGGLVLTLLVAMVAIKFIFHISLPQWPLLLGIVAATAIVSVGGDLFESLLKRLADVKDSGSLLPGHGGLLDRIDSVLSAIPFFALCVMLGW